MKDYIRNFFVGLPFGIIFGFFTWLSRDLGSGIVGGVIVSIVLGVLGTIFFHIQKVKFKKNGLQNTGGQRIIMDGPCNHFIGKDSVGGWMYLTEREVIFVSHNNNRLIHSLSISLDKITNVRFSFVLGFVPNGLSITTQTGQVEKFVLYSRKIWARKIGEVVLAQKTGFRKEHIC